MVGDRTEGKGKEKSRSKTKENKEKEEHTEMDGTYFYDQSWKPKE